MSKRHNILPTIAILQLQKILREFKNSKKFPKIQNKFFRVTIPC